MNKQSQNLEQEADRKADRRSLLYFSALLLLSLVLEATTHQLEGAREGASIGWKEPWLKEAASHIWLLALIPFTPKILTYAPLNYDTWRRALPVHVIICLVFGIVHVLGFVSMRKILYPILLGYDYSFGLAKPINWLYEIRKDAFTYILVICGFLINRAAQQRTMERDVAHSEAQSEKRIVLKSGGRTLYIKADDVIWAKAAGNYVEILTPQKTYLARMTLKTLEGLLGAAKTNHIRVHRSTLVNKTAITETVPTGQGDVNIHLSSGEIIQGSRRYRSQLMAL